MATPIQPVLDNKAQYGFAARDLAAQGKPVTRTYEQTLGLQAKTPQQNIKKPLLTLPKNQLATQPIKQGQAYSVSQSSSNNYPVAGNGVQITPPTTPIDSPKSLLNENPIKNPNPYAAPANAGYQGQLISGLAGMAANETPEVAQARQNLQNIQNAYAQRTGALERSGVDISLATGEEGVMARQQAAQQAAAQGAIANALTSQGQRGGFLGAAIGAAAPYQVSPGTTAYSPVTNQPVAGGAGGYQAFSNLQFNTQEGQRIGKQASDIQTASEQADANFTNLINLAGGVNLSQFPDLNAAIQAVKSRFGGDAGKVAAFNEAYNALQTSIGQIINSSGAFTPTEVSSLANKMSAARLNPAQMQELWNTVKTTAEIRRNALIKQAKEYESAGSQSVTGNMQQTNATGNQPVTWASL